MTEAQVSARVRAVLILPVVAVLAVLVVGVRAPYLLEDRTPDVLLLQAVGLSAAVAMAGALSSTLRARGTARLAWATVTAAVPFGAGSAALGLVDQDALGWGVARAVGTALLAAGLLGNPAARRSARDWGLIVVDGWMISASGFVLGWVGLLLTGSALGDHNTSFEPGLLWLPVDLLVASVLGGLAIRASGPARAPLLLLLLAAELAVTGDATWALAWKPQMGVLQFLVLGCCLGLAGALAAGHDLWQAPAADDERPRNSRWSHLAVVPGLFAAVFSHHDPVTVTVVSTVMIAFSAEILLVHRQNADLWNTLRHRATTDALTGLLNRDTFQRLVADRVGRGGAALLFVDLDGFKQVNDTEGHAAGDGLIRDGADTLRGCLAPGERAARLGGDEFAVLRPSPHAGEAVELAQRLVDAVAALRSPAGRRIGASVGVAAGGEVDGAGLVHRADLAMYEAKARGGRQVVRYDSAMHARIREQRRRVEGVDLACRRSGLELDLQPVVRLRDGQPVGVETLVRWRDGDELRPVTDVLTGPEDAAVRVQVGLWTLREALAWLAVRPGVAGGITVSLWPDLLAMTGFAETVARELKQHGVPPGRLTLVFSTDAMAQDVSRSVPVLPRLRRCGVRIGLDAIGDAATRIGDVVRLGADQIRVGAGYVDVLGTDARAESMVRACAGLADGLGVRMVATGVRTRRQRDLLMATGCGFGQGDFLAPARPASSFPYPGGSVIRAGERFRVTG